MGTQYSALLGNMTHLVSAGIEGVRWTGIPEDQVETVFGAIVGGEDKEAIRKAFFFEALKVAKAKKLIADYFDLGEGNVFLVDEYVDLKVNFSLSLEQIENKMPLSFGGGQKYLGKVPQRGTRKVRLAIGCMNQPGWTEQKLGRMLDRPNCPLKGSGAWVREAYLKFRTSPAKRGWEMYFPDPVTSRWLTIFDRYTNFPSLAWSNSEVLWLRRNSWIGDTHPVSALLCLVVVE